MSNRPKSKKPHRAKKRTQKSADRQAQQWTPEQLEQMSKTTDEDVDEVRAWLKETEQDEALAMFDAE